MKFSIKKIFGLQKHRKSPRILTEDEIEEILDLDQKHVKQRQIAMMTGISQSRISKIVRTFKAEREKFERKQKKKKEKKTKSKPKQEAPQYSQQPKQGVKKYPIEDQANVEVYPTTMPKEARANIEQKRLRNRANEILRAMAAQGKFDKPKQEQEKPKPRGRPKGILGRPKGKSTRTPEQQLAAMKISHAKKEPKNHQGTPEDPNPCPCTPREELPSWAARAPPQEPQDWITRNRRNNMQRHIYAERKKREAEIAEFERQQQQQKRIEQNKKEQKELGDTIDIKPGTVAEKYGNVKFLCRKCNKEISADRYYRNDQQCEDCDPNKPRGGYLL